MHFQLIATLTLASATLGLAAPEQQHKQSTEAQNDDSATALFSRQSNWDWCAQSLTVSGSPRFQLSAEHSILRSLADLLCSVAMIMTARVRKSVSKPPGYVHGIALQCLIQQARHSCILTGSLGCYSLRHGVVSPQLLGLYVLASGTYRTETCGKGEAACEGTFGAPYRGLTRRRHSNIVSGCFFGLSRINRIEQRPWWQQFQSTKMSSILLWPLNERECADGMAMATALYF